MDADGAAPRNPLLSPLPRTPGRQAQRAAAARAHVPDASPSVPADVVQPGPRDRGVRARRHPHVGRRVAAGRHRRGRPGDDGLMRSPPPARAVGPRRHRGWPRRRVLVGGLLLFALGNFVCAAAQNLPTLLAGRVLMGMGAVFTPVSAASRSRWRRRRRRLRAVARLPRHQPELRRRHADRRLARPALRLALAGRTGRRLRDFLAAAASSPCCRAPSAPGRALPACRACCCSRRYRGARPDAALLFTAIFTVFSYIGPVLHALTPLTPKGCRSR